MSITTTGLANEALMLARVKNTLTEIDTDTEPNAKVARQFLNAHIHELLEELDLRAFSVSVTLGDITDSEPPPFGWSYRYAWPADCVIPREITIAGWLPENTPIPFEEELVGDKSARSILCNEPNVDLRYTTDEYIESVNKWPWNFRRAVVYRLASSMAFAIKESPTIAEAMMNLYVDSTRMATFTNGAGRILRPSQSPGSLRARRGSRLT